MDKAIVPVLLLRDSVQMLNNGSFCTRSEDEDKIRLEQKGNKNVLNVLLLCLCIYSVI